MEDDGNGAKVGQQKASANGLQLQLGLGFKN